MGVGVAVAAVAMGATVIEKHFTLSRAEGGGQRFLLRACRNERLSARKRVAYEALGVVRYGPAEAEKRPDFPSLALCLRGYKSW